jgi:hypothetical protein
MNIKSISKKLLLVSSLLLGTSLSYTSSIQASFDHGDEVESNKGEGSKKLRKSKALVSTSRKGLSMNDMPGELLNMFVSYLQPHELDQAALVSKTFYHYCNEGEAWRGLMVQARLKREEGVYARHTVMAAMKSGHFYLWEVLGDSVAPSYALKIWTPVLKQMDHDMTDLQKRAYKFYDQGKRKRSDELYLEARLLKQNFKRVKFLWTYYSFPQSLDSYSISSLEHDDSSYITYKTEREKTYAQLGDIVEGEKRTAANKFWGMEGESIPRTKEDIARALILRARMHLEGHITRETFKHHTPNVEEAYDFLSGVIEGDVSNPLKAKAKLVMARDMFWQGETPEEDLETYKMLTSAREHLVSTKERDEADIYRARLRVENRIDSKTLDDSKTLEILGTLAKSGASKWVKATARYMLAKMGFEGRNPSLTKEEAFKQIAALYLSPSLSKEDHKEAENIVYKHGGIKMWLSYKLSDWQE